MRFARKHPQLLGGIPEARLNCLLEDEKLAAEIASTYPRRPWYRQQPPSPANAMTDHHYHCATPEQWTDAGAFTSDTRSRFPGLRARVEALEAQYETQRQATLAWGKDVDKHSRWIDGHLKRIMALEAAQKIRSGPESPLVERVADAIAAEATSAGIVNDRPARAAIREVVEWLAQNGWGDSADALMRQANRRPDRRGQPPTSPKDRIPTGSLVEDGKVKVLPDLSQRIIISLKWTQQTEELVSSLFVDRKIGAVPAHRGGQSIRFEVYADDPGLSDYGCGKLVQCKKGCFQGSSQ